MTANEKIAQKRLILLQLAEMCRTIYVIANQANRRKKQKVR